MLCIPSLLCILHSVKEQVGWLENGHWWDYLHHRNWQMLQINAFVFLFVREPVYQHITGWEHQSGNLGVGTLPLISWLLYILLILKNETLYLLLYHTWSSLFWIGKMLSEKERLKAPKKNAKYSQIHILGFIYPGSWTSILQKLLPSQIYFQNTCFRKKYSKYKLLYFDKNCGKKWTSI